MHTVNYYFYCTCVHIVYLLAYFVHTYVHTIDTYVHSTCVHTFLYMFMYLPTYVHTIIDMFKKIYLVTAANVGIG